MFGPSSSYPGMLSWLGVAESSTATNSTALLLQETKTCWSAQILRYCGEFATDSKFYMC